MNAYDTFEHVANAAAQAPTLTRVAAYLRYYEALGLIDKTEGNDIFYVHAEAVYGC